MSIPSWNVIFLLDKTPPSKIVLLKRAENKKFAPNMYTGVGGKVEDGETLLESAYRELEEETGLNGIKLQEFARAFINEEKLLCYFWGIYPKNILPESEDGTLEWTATSQILKKDLIPTTLTVCKYWANRSFSIDKPFIVYIKAVMEKSLVEKVVGSRIN